MNRSGGSITLSTLRNRSTAQALVVAIGAACALLIALPIQVAAQGRSTPSSGRPTSTTRSPADRDMYQREMNIKNLELDRQKRAAVIGTPSDTTIKEVREDFGRIQDINTEMIRIYRSGSAPDYKRISQAMAEIKRRAERLRANLVLPSGKADEQEHGPATARAARSPLLDLSDLITSFVTNPIFANANTIDATLGASARRDLESIVDLSDKISKSADKLSKVTARPD